MRGTMVFVLDARGKLLKRRIWEASLNTVYICNEERYQRLIKDYGSEQPPTAFPIQDVYCYDAAIEQTLSEGKEATASIRDRLKPFSERLAAK